MSRRLLQFRKLFNLRLRTKTFLRLVFLFFIPLLLASGFFLFRQYENLKDRLHFSFLTRADLLAGRIENLIKDRIAPKPGHPLLIRTGQAARASEIPAASPAQRQTIHDESTAYKEFFFVFVHESEPRVLYVRVDGPRFRYYEFQAEFLADFLFDSRLLAPDELFFLVNQGNNPGLSNLVSSDMQVPAGWLPHLASEAGNPLVSGEERMVDVDGKGFLLSVFPFPGLPLRVAIAKPVERAFAPLRRELMIQAIFLGAVLLAFLLYSLFAAREQIKPLKEIEEFLRRVSNKDFSYVPRIHARDERRTIFKSLNQLRLKLRRVDRLNTLELEKRNLRLEELNEQKNQFLGTAAHDLRNPLGVIQGFASFLLEDAADRMEPEHRMFLERIHGSSESMLHLVNDLLDIARIESGALDLNLQPTDPREFVRNAVELNRVLAGKKQIQIGDEYDPAVGAIPMDVPKMEQVLNNLLGNAIKFSEMGTQIVVRVSVRPNGDGVAISVRDQGQGIPAAELKQIFRPFTRASTRATAGERSTGLGLAIVNRIVQGHGGTIEVASEVGHGSTFTVLLPGTRAD